MTTQKDPIAEKITAFFYKVRVPYLQSRSINDIAKHGVNVCGVKEIDKDIENQLLTTYMTIENMVMYFKEGVSIRIIDPKDVKPIYTSISEYLESWKQQLTYGVNIGGAPFEYLMAMDQFANSVYSHAKYHFSKDLIESIMARHMAEISPLNQTNFFRSSPFNTPVNKDTEEESKRNSLADFLESRMINFKGAGR